METLASIVLVVCMEAGNSFDYCVEARERCMERHKHSLIKDKEAFCDKAIFTTFYKKAKCNK